VKEEERGPFKQNMKRGGEKPQKVEGQEKPLPHCLRKKNTSGANLDGGRGKIPFTTQKKISHLEGEPGGREKKEK